MALSTDLADNWPVLSPLLDEALDLPSERRRTWLARLPQEHWPLRTALAQLLETPSESSLAGTAGPWRLIQKIGEGGMAQVWLAERCDGLLVRPVALKIPRPGWGNSLFCQRLSREREILDGLNHPNIARLLDAGVAADGQPYLVLEYVEGERIDDYCRNRNLPIAGRLELFLQIAAAIASAHHQLVLHRDLKPSNILVTEEGQVRVLDFGIAKLLERGQAEETDLTFFVGRALTLDYASPEQIAGRPLTVASDVYSLGVVLYELLTGTRPYKLDPESPEQVHSIEPAPPSQAVCDSELRRSIKGDLDRVVLMALRKLPGERYVSVESFAEDIQRYLDKRPVLARPSRRWYRASMFVHRHRLALAATMLLLLLLLAATAITAWQARVALAQKKQAEEAKSLVLSMLFDAHSYWGSGKPLSALDLLRQVQQRLMTRPAVNVNCRVQILNILGAGLLSQQDTANAESTLRYAIDEADKLVPSDPERLRARLLMNWVLLFRGETTTVRAGVEVLLGDMRRYGSAFPEDLAGALRIRSSVAAEECDPTKAVSFALAALRAAESTLGVRHNQSVLALVELCHAYESAGQRQLAVETGERAVSRALGAYANSATHPNTIKARLAFAQAVAGSGNPVRGIQLAQEAIRDTSALFGPSSRLTGIGFKMLAKMQLEAGQQRAARESIERSQSILADHFHAGSPGWLSLLKLCSDIQSRCAPVGAARIGKRGQAGEKKSL